MINYNLLDNEVRIQTPFVKVVIGDYTFGIFQKSSTTQRDSQGIYKIQNIQYPNYIQSLQVEKINGQVNKYTLNISYSITQFNDPNFFEKVFSSISETRKIIFSYGDLSAPAFVYRNEEAIITRVSNQIDISSANINYTVKAVSSSNMAKVGVFNFPAYSRAKPSAIIKDILRNNSTYGLLDLFTGMRDMNLVEQKGLIAGDDIYIPLEAKRNISVLEYIQYLVNSMKSSVNNKDIYAFNVIDSTDEIFKGPYFKIVNTTKAGNSLDCYSLDIGYDYRNNNAVTNFSIDNQEAYSIFYKWSKKLSSNEYTQRIDDNGNLISIYAPIISSKNEQGVTYPDDENWWKSVTQYPIKASITIRGLLRPAILMSSIDIGCIFYGKLHSSTGKYIVTKQVDNIGMDGFYTTLSLVRVGPSERYPSPKI